VQYNSAKITCKALFAPYFNCTALLHFMNESNQLLTSEETAQRLRISKACLWQKCRTGEMPHIKLSARNFRFREADLERWLKERSR